jgi:hypothetical protein
MSRTQIARLAILALMLVFTVGAAHANTITLASLGTAADAGQTNANGNTIVIPADDAWAAALPGSQWVSYTTTSDMNGSSFVIVPNGTVVAFYDTFNITGSVTSASITVMADDTTSVSLNGHLLMADAPTTNNTYATCSDFAIGCLTSTALTINLPSADFVTGQNTLEFDVEQMAGWSYGLDYAGTIDDPSPAPEPASLLLFASGAFALAGVLRKKLA